MIDRQDFLDSLLKECEICKHLYTKIAPDTFDFRPTPGQRSTLELLRYLAVCGSASMHVMTNGSDWSLWKPYTAHIAEMPHEDFPAAMDRQAEVMKKIFLAIPDEDLRAKEVKHPTGTTMPMGVGLMRMTFSWLTAYRMQLFLYAKQSGAEEIGTSNNWAGMDRKKA